MNSFLQFLDSLFESGNLSLAPPAPMTPSELDSGVLVIEGYEQRYRKQLPFEPPEVNRVAARWAAESFYRASQAIVYRDVEPEAVTTEFDGDGGEASNHYSVDLVFRFLPDLLSFGNSANREDPTCELIRNWATAWPLSSVGMKLNVDLLKPEQKEDLPELVFDVSGFENDPCLLQLYVDRILQTGDQSRLEAAVVVERIRQTIGEHSELAGRLLDRIKPE